MKHLQTLVAGDELRDAAARLVERLGTVQVISAGQWRHVADQCCLTTSDDASSTTVLVGPPAFVLKHAASADENFGFVMPVAQSSRAWQRAATWRDDATLGLWRAGWSPRALDRILVPTHQALVEFVIGDVRRIPSVGNQPDGS